MLAKYEYRTYCGDERVWVGKYRNLRNLPHWHYDCELVTVERGRAEISIESRRFTLSEGQSVFINSKQIHYITGEADSVLSFILYDRKLTERLTKYYNLSSPLLTQKYPIFEVTRAISKEFEKKDKFYALAVNQHLTSLILSIFRRELTVDNNEKADQNNERYKLLLEDIDQNYCFYSFERARDFMAFSAPYFSKCFHNLSGMTFSQYLNYVRVEKAIELIKSDGDLTITEISTRCGFDTIRNFNRVFRSVTGYSPKALPKSYDFFHMQPISKSEAFDPTDEQSELIT